MQGKRQLGLPSDDSLISKEKRPAERVFEANRTQGERAFAPKRNSAWHRSRSSRERCCASTVLVAEARVVLPPEDDTGVKPRPVWLAVSTGCNAGFAS